MLNIKKSQLPSAGQGLWAEKDFKRGEIIVQYNGEKITWKECERRNLAQEGYGCYYLFISKNKCIDAQYTIWAKGRYANDAAGLCRIAGLRNNSKYEIIKGKVFIKGEYWRATSEKPIKKGAKVKVIKVEGLSLIVEEIKK